MDDAEVAAKLLWKMKRLGAWGTRHISESNLQKGFPPAARGRRLLAIAETLRKEGLLFKRPSHHEPQWSLVWEMRDEVDIIIGKMRGNTA
jgi:hypothetical protein